MPTHYCSHHIPPALHPSTHLCTYTQTPPLAYPVDSHTATHIAPHTPFTHSPCCSLPVACLPMPHHLPHTLPTQHTLLPTYNTFLPLPWDYTSHPAGWVPNTLTPGSPVTVPIGTPSMCSFLVGFGTTTCPACPTPFPTPSTCHLFCSCGFWLGCLPDYLDLYTPLGQHITVPFLVPPSPLPWTAASCPLLQPALQPTPCWVPSCHHSALPSCQQMIPENIQ